MNAFEEEKRQLMSLFKMHNRPPLEVKIETLKSFQVHCEQKMHSLLFPAANEREDYF